MYGDDGNGNGNACKVYGTASRTTSALFFLRFAAFCKPSPSRRMSGTLVLLTQSSLDERRHINQK